jgi:hypothetical protein
LLGREIIAQGHVLLGGCRNSLDAIITEAALEEAQVRQLELRRVIRSWLSKAKSPAHANGEIVRSRMVDWGQIPRGYIFPEPVQEADVVIVVGGTDGTQFAASWVRLANKPIVPVATLGRSAAEIYQDELSVFDRRYAARLSVDDYQILDRVLPDWEIATLRAFAKDVVSLAERLVMPNDVFVIMSFAEKGHLKDAYNTFQRVCQKYGFHAFKVDQHMDSTDRIVPAIFSSIRRAAFVIADVSEERPNVYFELGYAKALDKEIVMTATEETELPFDVFDIPMLSWDCQDTLEQKLHAQISRLALKFGRHPNLQ